MKAYVYDIKTKIINLKFYNVSECGKDFIKGFNETGEKRSVYGMNLNQVSYIITDEDFREGEIINISGVVDKKNNLFSQEEKIKSLEEKLEKLTQLLENK